MRTKDDTAALFGSAMVEAQQVVIDRFHAEIEAAEKRGEERGRRSRLAEEASDPEAARLARELEVAVNGVLDTAQDVTTNPVAAFDANPADGGTVVIENLRQAVRDWRDAGEALVKHARNRVPEL